MIVRYEFNTTSEDYDPIEHAQIKQAANTTVALFDILDSFRSWIKYGNCPHIDEQSYCWEYLSEEEKELYKKNKFPDLERMQDEIITKISSAGVNLNQLGL